MLVLRDLKARTKQAYLGYFWILIQPLLLTGAFSYLVQQVLGRSDLSEVPYPVFVMAGIIPWQFFANSLNESAESLVKNVDLVRQVYFFHVGLSGWVLLLPVIVLVEMLFAAAIGMLLSAANVGWRDVSRGLPLVLFLMLYAVPVLYSPDRVPAAIRPLFDLNPMAHLVDAFRAAVLGTHAPDLVGLGVLAALGVFTLLVAQRLFSVFDGVLADVI
jgi:lipopolysaccharide transport system permease protein